MDEGCGPGGPGPGIIDNYGLVVLVNLNEGLWWLLGAEATWLKASEQGQPLGSCFGSLLLSTLAMLQQCQAFHCPHSISGMCHNLLFSLVRICLPLPPSPRQPFVVNKGSGQVSLFPIKLLDCTFHVDVYTCFLSLTMQCVYPCTFFPLQSFIPQERDLLNIFISSKVLIDSPFQGGRASWEAQCASGFQRTQSFTLRASRPGSHLTFMPWPLSSLNNQVDELNQNVETKGIVQPPETGRSKKWVLSHSPEEAPPCQTLNI